MSAEKDPQQPEVELPVGLTREQLRSLQAVSPMHIAFSLTEACPLKCRHCVLPDKMPAAGANALTVNKAEDYARQIERLKKRGVEYISFTGGEPLLAPAPLRILSEAATLSGMKCALVTACHWATSDDIARQVIESYPNVENWHFSTDIFHLEFVPLENILRAARAAIAARRSATIRMSVASQITPSHVNLYKELRRRLPEGVEIFGQVIIAKKEYLELQDNAMAIPITPCVPIGMVVRGDGTVSPCCIGLIYDREGHPFQYGNVNESGLEAAHHAWCTDPLLQLLRAIGFGPVLQWLREDMPAHPVFASVPLHPCECCLALWREPGVCSLLRQRAATPENRAMIAELAASHLGESFMLQA